MESKHDKFIRIAEQRTNGVINKIRLISNLSNRNNYEYDKGEVNEIFRAIEEELKVAKLSFNKEMNNHKNFKITRKRD